MATTRQMPLLCGMLLTLIATPRSVSATLSLERVMNFH